MKITFPHIGNTYITAKAFLDDFGSEYVVPPFNTNKTLELGSKYTAESHCLPFKLFVGNMLQAYEQGADTMLITGGCGPCKLGYFGEMLKKTASEIGIKMDIITLEVPDQGFKELAARIKKVSGTSNYLNVAKVVNSAKNVAIQLDKLERLSRLKRARQLEPRSVDKIYGSFQREVLEVKGSKEILKFIKQTERKLKRLPQNEKARPLKVGIVGEIYTTIEPYANFQLERLLGNMGVEVIRQVTVSGWIIDDMLKKALRLPLEGEDVRESRAYLSGMVGGHAHHTIGNTVVHAKEGFDGVIHLYPLGCMPEIVSQSILPAVEENYQIPVMTVIRDEMTGEAGFNTRVEAFVDLIRKRREEQQNGQNKMLYGY